jgi:hypothetical protein
VGGPIGAQDIVSRKKYKKNVKIIIDYPIQYDTKEIYQTERK